METREWAKLQESLLKSQLKVIREFLRKDEEPKFIPRKKRKSQMNIVYNILLTSREPLHITRIIDRAKEDFSVTLDRDSAVSAIAKKVKSGRMFKRVSPNTFTILEKQEKNTS